MLDGPQAKSLPTELLPPQIFSIKFQWSSLLKGKALLFYIFLIVNKSHEKTQTNTVRHSILSDNPSCLSLLETVHCIWLFVTGLWVFVAVGRCVCDWVKINYRVCAHGDEGPSAAVWLIDEF